MLLGITEEEVALCRFNAKCTNKLCQFRHTQNITESSEEEDAKTTRKENIEVEPSDKKIDKSIEDENEKYLGC